ncbi:HPP family protein [Nonomuraea sp. SMC257]|uniref:HPP family protein n=1 Tax=Nonomuraea montanisoli TaxID=2741721 RepID=A0A7Y6M303_9ACTN|nr:HPP family protein [Nonomuraea montanisoli]NUW32702.1 HPP family protein [Nonomuraea montanisoli]
MPDRLSKRRHADHPALPTRHDRFHDRPARDAQPPVADEKPLRAVSGEGRDTGRVAGALRRGVLAGGLGGWTSQAPARAPLSNVVKATGAALAALLVLAGVTSLSGLALFALPFVASAAIVALVPAAPFAQPRSIVLGHVAATVVALAVTGVAGPSIWAAAVAAALTTAPMMLLRAPHPPAAATAALIGLTAPAPWYLLTPVAAAGAIVIASGVLLGRLLPGHRYPAYWL